MIATPSGQLVVPLYLSDSTLVSEIISAKVIASR